MKKTITIILFLLIPFLIFCYEIEKPIKLENSNFQSSEITKATDPSEKIGWRLWSRIEGTLHIAYANGTASIRHTTDRDWSFSNSTKISVKQGDTFIMSCRMKVTKDTKNCAMYAVGLNKGKTVNWRLAQTPTARGDKKSLADNDFKNYKVWFSIGPDIDQIYLRFTGSGVNELEVDDVQLIPQDPNKRPTPTIQFSAIKSLSKKPKELLSRGLIVFPTKNGNYLSWRQLSDEDKINGYDIYKFSKIPQKVNDKPISKTTDYLDTNGTIYDKYYVIPTNSSDISKISENSFAIVQTEKRLNTTSGKKLRNLPENFISIKLDSDFSDATFEKIAFADLDGDGNYDFIIKTPGTNVDPADSYHYASKETYKIHAYSSTGKHIWTKDLGWNIETGSWYSAFVAADLDGDGKSEIIIKSGNDSNKDYRDSEGRVMTGPEYLSILDGMTGTEIAKAPWISREGFEDYNRSSRNQIAIAYLDGKTPCIITLRGTYGFMRAEAWQFIRQPSISKPQLVQLWSYSNEFLDTSYKGQGAHNTLCVDINDDGFDEIILGSAILDHDGKPLRTTGRGHPDAVYFGNLDPNHTGNEILYIMETRQTTGGINMVDAKTGRELWKLDEKSDHIHSSGLCADIDNKYPGMEIFGSDSIDHKKTNHRWLFTSDGKIIKKHDAILSGIEEKWPFAPRTVYWDADTQREFLFNSVCKYKTDSPDYEILSKAIEGRFCAVADILGDWREEIITSLPGEIRIYCTGIPATDKKTCQMLNKDYRSKVMMNSNAYYQTPINTDLN